ncbi:hypothetical protein HDA32_004528 [Spinactinospora alkalitolerans]|uniref:PucR family transcriptional regulator n=1 Tax=Spinactinospora alkalitolerans TaxID=687207 RepID=A0A852TZQ8_9ACTN|nr:helix-turn-helix domain-containing protein [Spinactinospora alkalitolerans]NYE49408.1 hypothetical protein [Spinactinospora alkalitolerans]
MHQRPTVTGLRENPLATIPAEIADRLRPALDSTTDEIVADIQSRIAEYARPRDANYLRVTRAAVEHALQAFMERMGDPDPRAEELHQKFRAIGAGEAHEGRNLDSLQTAMRSGAVISWRRIAEMSESTAIPRHYISLLAEAAFLFLEEIAGAAVEGYSQARAKAAGELQRRRGRLINLLLAEEPAAPEAIADLARAARWRVPASIAAVTLHYRDREPVSTPTLPPDVLVDFNRLDPCLLLPDPDGPGRLQSLGRALQGWDAAVGPAMEVADAAASLKRAQDTLALVRSGLIPGSGIIRWTEHLTTLMLFADEALLHAMAEARLAPLEELRPAQRDRMAETLLSWLQTGYNANEVAARLHVHPQTVRYRLRRLEELFGDRLRDPDQRFELEMVLRMRGLKSRAGRRREREGGDAASVIALPRRRGER